VRRTGRDRRGARLELEAVKFDVDAAAVAAYYIYSLRVEISAGNASGVI
jgi:hypothetical protein